MLRLLALASLVGCVPLSYAYTPASSQASNPKPEGCTFEVLTTPPTTDYEEVGYFAHYNGDAPNDLDKFRKAVADQVCHAGGDAVIAIANDKGLYTKGTVIRPPKRFTPGS